MSTCIACGNTITPEQDKGIIWDGKPVHLVCGGPYTTIQVHPYHQHIFWNEVVPWGFYLWNPDTTTWEDVQAQAVAHGLKVSRDPELGWGPFKDYEFMVLELEAPTPPWT